MRFNTPSAQPRLALNLRWTRHWPSSLVMALLATATLLGCVEKSGHMTAAQRERLKALVTEKAPTPTHPLSVKFEDKVELIGYDVSSDRWGAGEALEVVWYWKVNKPLGSGWRLFTHIADAKDEHGMRLNQDVVGPIREIYQPEKWKAGQYIKDVQPMTLPADWDQSRAFVYVGLWKGNERLNITSGPNDGDRRARLLSIVTEAGQGTGLPALRARFREEPIVIDGKLDEADWKGAPTTGAFVNTMTGDTAEPKASAKVIWDDTHLYVGFEVADDYLKSDFTKQDDHLWEQDCVEIMVDPDGDGRNYFEMQVSPAGVSFDTRYDTRRRPQPFGDVAWQSELEAKVHAKGTLNDDDDDGGYTVELRIPFTSFATGPKPAAKPQPANEWRMNFFVMDTRKKGQRAVGWSPPRVGDFHTLDKFGTVRFDGAMTQPGGATEAANADEATSAGAAATAAGATNATKAALPADPGLRSAAKELKMMSPADLMKLRDRVKAERKREQQP